MPENASLNVEFQNFLAIGKDGLGSPSLGPGSSVREKGKKPVERAKKTRRVKWATHWTGKGERAAEPGEMPWHCHHSIYWHQVLISCYDWSNVSMLTNLRCCWQMKYHALSIRLLLCHKVEESPCGLIWFFFTSGTQHIFPWNIYILHILLHPGEFKHFWQKCHINSRCILQQSGRQ